MSCSASECPANIRKAQTPEQRLRNQKFAKENTARMGKPESAIKRKDKEFKSPISPLWLGRWHLSLGGVDRS
jgi:hypothetical protein